MIVGGGIAAGVPFTLGSLTRIVIVDPPTIADSLAFQRTQTGVEVITMGTNSFPTATEKLQVVGGLISDTGAHDNVLIGRGAAAQQLANARNTVIGTGAVVSGGVNALENVVIGFNAIMNQGVGNCVIIGQNFTFGATAPAGSLVAIGSGIIVNNSASGPVIGAGATAQGAGVLIGNQGSTGAFNNYVAIGRSVDVQANGATAVGDNTTVSAGHSASVVLGRDATSLAANSFIVGAINQRIGLVLIGEGDTQDPPSDVTYRNTNATGNNVSGAVEIHIASRGTGNAIGGGFRWQVAITPAAAAGTLQSLQTVLEITTAAGTAADPHLRWTGTNGAGAAVGTLTNAPHAGNPDVWITLYANGVAVGVPAWNI